MATTTANKNVSKLSTLNYGVEIEATVKRDASVQPAGYHSGRGQIAGLGHVGTMTQDWRAESDSSIRTRGQRRPVEFISPILNGTDGLRSINAAVKTMKAEYDAKTNKSCGVHITVEWNGTEEQLQRLISLVGHYADALLGITGTTYRERCGYANNLRSISVVTLNSASSAHR